MTAEAQASDRAILKVVDPSGHSRTIPLERLPFTIGRQADNDLALRDIRTSRHHARIVEEQGRYVIEDLGSTRGAYVNGERVERRALHSGDRITFGVENSYEITFIATGGEIGKVLSQLTAPSGSARAGAENLAKLRAVVEVARALQGSLSTDSVLDAVIDAALTITGTQRGFLLLKEGEDLDIRVARDQRGMRIPKEDLRVPTGLINRALHQRRDLLTMNFDPNEERGVQPDHSVANLELRSVVCVPLVRVKTAAADDTIYAPLNETLGLLYLDSRVEEADLSAGNRELLQTLAVEASTILENARLLEEERERQKLEEELRVAREIQQSLLPKDLPESGWFRAAGSSIASREVGGDYFDTIPVGDDRWATVVADVCGKGVSSALLASLIQGVVLRGAETPEQIRSMLERMNHFLLERTEGEKYATLFYCVLRADGELRWANAAHCAPVLVRRAGGLEKLPPSGMPVGMLDFATYDVESKRLEPGDKLVIYTDGVTEAVDEQGRFFEDKRVMAAIRANAAASCAELHDRLLNELKAFTGEASQSDDITLVVVEYQPG